MMLAQMQQQFRDWLVEAGDENAIGAHLGATAGLPIYQNNYRVQLVSVMEASYPLLLARIGEDNFVQAAIHHIDRHPPSTWTLDVYGADFIDTLRELYPHNPDLHELAWIEWALAESFVAADAPGIAVEDLADIDWDAAQLTLSPSLRQYTVTTNVYAVWSALQDELEIPDAEMLAAHEAVIVWRKDFTSRLRQVDAIQHTALLALNDDAHFGSMCDALVEHLGEAEGVTRAGSLLMDWIASGVVVDIVQAA